MRNRFDRELDELNIELIKMGNLCEEVIGSATRALYEGNLELAQEVLDNGSEIDQMERDIEQRCMKLVLHQQPVSRDLRLISAANKMITDMERIGDQAEDIAGITKSMGGRTSEYTDSIYVMSQAAVKMVTDSVDAFVRKDVRAAMSVIEYDNVVDDFFDRTKYNIIEMIKRDTSDSEFALELLMIAKYLERIGDHATNIAEWVIYAVTGRHKEE